jgi:hypothetical protein
MQCNSSLSFNGRFGNSSPCARHEGKWTNGGLAPLILIFGTRWSPVVSFTLRPLYSRERAPGTLDAPRSGRYVLNNRNLLTLTAIEPRPAGSPSGSPATVLTVLSHPQYVWLQRGVSSEKFSKNSHDKTCQSKLQCARRHKRAKFLLYVERNRTFSDNALWAVTSHSTRLNGVTSSKTLMYIFTVVLPCKVSDLCRFLLHSY